MSEKVIRIIHSDKAIGCCGGHAFQLIAVNGGFTTECTCGCWCGQWHKSQYPAIEYFENMIKIWHDPKFKWPY